MSIVDGRSGAHRTGDGLYRNCPQCGLSIIPRANGLRIEHCPRCLGRSGTLVGLFASSLPTKELYRHDLAPDAEGPTERHARRDR